MAKQDLETLAGLIKDTLLRSHPAMLFETVEVRDGFDRDGVDSVKVFLTRGPAVPLPDDELDAIAYEIEDVVRRTDERAAVVYFPDAP